jgi:hypothetical protein
MHRPPASTSSPCRVEDALIQRRPAPSGVWGLAVEEANYILSCRLEVDLDYEHDVVWING